MLNRKWTNFENNILKIFERKSNEQLWKNYSSKPMLKLQVRDRKKNKEKRNLFHFVEKLNREPTPEKSETKTSEDLEVSTKEDNETSTEPTDAEQIEKGTNPDDEQQPTETAEEAPKPPSPPATEEPPKAPSPPPKAPSPPPPAAASPTDVPQDDLRGLGPEDQTTEAIPVGEITPDHPEVKKAVEQAVEEARNAAVTIPPDVYAELMHKAIQETEQEHRDKNPQGPL